MSLYKIALGKCLDLSVHLCIKVLTFDQLKNNLYRKKGQSCETKALILT